MSKAGVTAAASLSTYREAFLELKEDSQVIIASLSREQLNRKPAPGKWSIGQCFSHLIEAGAPLEQSMEQAIEEAGEGKRVDDPVDIRHGVFGKLFIYFLGPETGIPMPSPRSFTPSSDELDPDDLSAEFQQLQDGFISCIDQASHFDVNRIRLPSPAIPFVWFRMGTWLEATVQHERRHVQQALRIRRATGVSL